MRALAAERPSVRVALHLAEEKEPIFVLGDALELELLFLNLLRNAAQAAEHTANQQADGAFITVSVVLVSSNGGVPRVCVRIENEGPQLDEAVIAELNSRASGFVRAMRGEEGIRRLPNWELILTTEGSVLASQSAAALLTVTVPLFGLKLANRAALGSRLSLTELADLLKTIRPTSQKIQGNELCLSEST